MVDAHHVPVLLERVQQLVAPSLAQPGAVFVDTTLGLGGHTEAMLTAFDNIHVIGIDRDGAALRDAAERLEPFTERVTLVQAVYDDISTVVHDLGYDTVSGILFDLGVSSMQLDLAERGFAYSQDAPLDMRMDESQGRTAADLLNEYDVRDLARVLRVYGEERFANKIAHAIVRERERAPFDTSARLVEVVRDSIPQAARRTGGNPAKRTFQALRIEVNDELRVLERALPSALDLLAVGGRVVVLAYHSLEDRLVKRAFAAVSESRAPHDLPVVPAEMLPSFRLLTRGSEKAGESEIADNRRSQSVRLRAIERIAA